MPPRYHLLPIPFLRAARAATVAAAKHGVEQDQTRQQSRRRAPVASLWSLLLVTIFGLFAGGCASVPDTQFLKHRYTAQAAEFKTAWGPIPAKRSEAILDQLKRSAGNLDILDRQVALEQVLVGKPLVLGNKVTLLQDGPATYEAMMKALRSAQKTINVETYIFDDEEVGRKFADILLERRAAGVAVNVLYDSVGSFKTDKAIFERLRQGGVQVVEYNPVNPLRARWHLRRVNHRDHRKLMVIDGRTAFLGGINIDSVYSSGSSSGSGGSSGGSSSGGSSGKKKDPRKSGWRDTDVQIDGPVVADFQRLFLQNWAKQRGPQLNEADYLPTVAPQGHEIVRAIGTSPDDAYSLIYLTLMAAVMNAQKEVYITNAYFVPDPQLVDALIAAAKRGVDVRLILPSTTDSRSAAYAAHSHYEDLLRGGVKIYERRAVLLHAKTAVIDGVWSCIGSSNLDWRSAVDNDEINAVILSRDFAQQMLNAYALDQAQSDEIHLETWLHRSWQARLKENLFRICGRLL